MSTRFAQSRRPFRSVAPRSLLALLLGLFLLPSRAGAYVEAPYTLGRIIQESTNILIMRVEKVDKEKGTIIYRKVRDLKGTNPTDTIKHNIAHNGYQPRESQYVMAWAQEGQTAVFFHNGSAGECCIENYWYQIYPGDWWNMSHGEPFLLRSFAGKPDKCAAAVQAIIAGQEVTVPAMVDGDKEALHVRSARIQRLKASMKIQDYDPKRDFAGWGQEEFRLLRGMPAFTHYAPLPALGAGALGCVPIDYDNDHKTDLCLFGAERVVLLQNAGMSTNEVGLPVEGGARAAAWADYNGDGKPDLLLATPTGPKLLTNLGENKFRNDSLRLPAVGYYNLTGAAWIDYEGKPAILLSDGFRGLCLYRNLGTREEAPPKVTLGKWFQCGPFDNAGGTKGFDTAFPPESGIDLKAEYPGKNDQKATWKECPYVDGQANSVKIYREQDHANMVVFLYREIESNKPVQMPVSLGSGGTVTMWVNGEQVLADKTPRAPAPDALKATLKLKAGKNALLIKSCFGEHNRSYYFMPTPPDEKAVTTPLFEDVSEKAGLGPSGAAGSLKGDRLLVADVNNDGRPDILYCAGQGVLLLNTPAGFVVSKDSGLSFHTGGVTPLFARLTGGKGPDLFVPNAPATGGCRLFKNDAAGHFTDVTAKAGDLAHLSSDAGAAAGGGPDATCAAAADFTGGGKEKAGKLDKLDLMIGCRRGPNRLLRNNGDGTFTDATESAGLFQRVFNTRGIAPLDFNGDGTPDVVFVNEGAESALLLGKPR